MLEPVPDRSPLPAHHKMPEWSLGLRALFAHRHASRTITDDHDGDPLRALMAAVAAPPSRVIPLHDLHEAFSAAGTAAQVTSWLPTPCADEATSVLISVEPARKLAIVLAIVARDEHASGSWLWHWAEFAGGTTSDVGQETEADARALAERMIVASTGA